MFKIVLTGPESTGKTTLATQLAQHYGAMLVEEYARIYARDLNRPFKPYDLQQIVKGQMSLELSAMSNSPDILVADTDLLTLEVWAEDKFQMDIPGLLNLKYWENVDLYILCYPDLEWAPDPLREDQWRREELFKIYHDKLMIIGVPYIIVQGKGDSRLASCIQQIESAIKFT